MGLGLAVVMRCSHCGWLATALVLSSCALPPQQVAPDATTPPQLPEFPAPEPVQAGHVAVFERGAWVPSSAPGTDPPALRYTQLLAPADSKVLAAVLDRTGALLGCYAALLERTPDSRANVAVEIFTWDPEKSPWTAHVWVGEDWDGPASPLTLEGLGACVDQEVANALAPLVVEHGDEIGRSQVSITFMLRPRRSELGLLADELEPGEEVRYLQDGSCEFVRKNTDPCPPGSDCLLETRRPALCDPQSRDE